MIIADENIDQHLIDFLTEKGFDILSIRVEHSGISDLEVIEVVKENKGVLLTEDKDFGELVFAHGFSGVAVVFLRYSKAETEQIKKNLLVVLEKYYPSEDNFFITITPAKTRLIRL
ncbi:MAG: DUF5615 family PIN-like protein [Flavobacteriales bacterium]|nr:DUF5615 family PIN-like protein [Flavobacteriales bacterium]